MVLCSREVGQRTDSFSCAFIDRCWYVLPRLFSGGSRNAWSLGDSYDVLLCSLGILFFEFGECEIPLKARPGARSETQGICFPAAGGDTRPYLVDPNATQTSHGQTHVAACLVTCPSPFPSSTPLALALAISVTSNYPPCKAANNQNAISLILSNNLPTILIPPQRTHTTTTTFLGHIDRHAGADLCILWPTRSAIGWNRSRWFRIPSLGIEHAVAGQTLGTSIVASEYVKVRKTP
jgi:hypothetical protein